MRLHQVEIIFHQAGSTKDLGLMLSLFADDATLTSGGRTWRGKDEIATYWKAAVPFRSQNQWVAYTPAQRIRFTVEGDHARLYFECLYVDRAAKAIATHTFSQDTLVRTGDRWLIQEMKAGPVTEL